MKLKNNFNSKLLNRKLALDLWSKVDNFLFDCDGVIYNWPHEINGSVEFINKAKELGKNCYFVTNNSTRTRETFLKILKEFGIKDIDQSHILCTAWVFAQHLKSIEFKDKVYLVGNEAMSKELDKVGIKHSALDENKDFVFNSTNYQDIKLDPEVKCVAIGYDFEFNFQKMIYASSYVNKNDCKFFATNDDNCIPTGCDNILVPDAGPILASVERSTGKKATVIGKPNAIMWHTLSEHHNLDPKRTCMIGDRMDTDILFASNSSLGFSLLVLSGITSEQDLFNQENLQNGQNQVPDFYINSLGDFLKFFDQD